MPAVRLFCVVVAFLGACATETGIVVEVTREDIADPPAIKKLKFTVGVMVQGTNGPLFVRDEASSVEVDVEGRDLLADPYQLILRPGASHTTAVQVAVRGVGADEVVVAVSAMSSPQQFVDSEMLLHHVTLDFDAFHEERRAGCIKVEAPGGVGVEIGSSEDMDCDDVTPPTDCDDMNAGVNPGVTEICANGIDENCVNGADEETDIDRDQVTNCGGDCDDNDGDRTPGKEEICDGKDNDCNGLCDDTFDEDLDQYTFCGTKLLEDGTCALDVAADCDPGNGTVHPGHEEICDGLDNDCNTLCDDNELALNFDPDGDFFTECGSIVGRCLEPTATSDAFADCAVDVELEHPFAHEACDGIDMDCAGTHPASLPCFHSDAELGCSIGVAVCDDDGADGASGPGACAAPLDVRPFVSPEACTAYDLCADDPERFYCAANRVATSTFTCVLNWERSSGALCPLRGVPLPLPVAADSCTWTLVGGRLQEMYNVSLVMEGSTVGAEVIQSCTGGLRVDGTAIPVPQDQDLVLTRSITNSIEPAQVFTYHLDAQVVDTCPTTGLVCTMSN
jgi:hypothetical protein